MAVSAPTAAAPTALTVGTTGLNCMAPTQSTVNVAAPGAVIAGCPGVDTGTNVADKPLTLRGAQRVWTAVPGGPTWRGVGHLTATAARVP